MVILVALYYNGCKVVRCCCKCRMVDGYGVIMVVNDGSVMMISNVVLSVNGYGLVIG